MSVSVFFVEFLRTRAHGTGWPDALTRLSRVWERVGRGEGFADGFTGEFSQSLESLEQEFVRFVASTEGDRTARLGRTAYDATVGQTACAAAPAPTTPSRKPTR